MALSWLYLLAKREWRTRHCVTCNMVVCHLPATAYDDIENGCGNRACDRYRFGFRTSTHRSSAAKRTSNRRSSPQANTMTTIKPSSTRYQSTGTTLLKVRRGDIYTAAARGAYIGKPRPVVVVQDDRFNATASVTVVPFTTSNVEAPLLRISVQPSAATGLITICRLMIDKVTTVPRRSLTQQIGRLSDGDLIHLDRALLVFLGLAG